MLTVRAAVKVGWIDKAANCDMLSGLPLPSEDVHVDKDVVACAGRMKYGVKGEARQERKSAPAAIGGRDDPGV